MKQNHYIFEVTGRGRFPFDMLRFGRLYPVFTTDAEALGVDVNDRDAYRAKRTVKLATTCNEASADMIVRRFSSFMWKAEIVQSIPEGK